jgi:hypothetical protein
MAAACYYVRLRQTHDFFMIIGECRWLLAFSASQTAWLDVPALYEGITPGALAIVPMCRCIAWLKTQVQISTPARKLGIVRAEAPLPGIPRQLKMCAVGFACQAVTGSRVIQWVCFPLPRAGPLAMLGLPQEQDAHAP